MVFSKEFFLSVGSGTWRVWIYPGLRCAWRSRCSCPRVRRWWAGVWGRGLLFSFGRWYIWRICAWCTWSSPPWSSSPSWSACRGRWTPPTGRGSLISRRIILRPWFATRWRWSSLPRTRSYCCVGYGVLFGDLGIEGKFRKLHFFDRLVGALLYRFHILLHHVSLLKPKLPGQAELVVEDGPLAQVHIRRLDHAKWGKLGCIEGEQSRAAALKDVGCVEDQFFGRVWVALLHSSEYNSINKLETGISNLREGWSAFGGVGEGAISICAWGTFVPLFV